MAHDEDGGSMLFYFRCVRYLNFHLNAGHLDYASFISLICRTRSLRCNVDTIAMNAIFCTVVLSVI